MITRNFRCSIGMFALILATFANTNGQANKTEIEPRSRSPFEIARLIRLSKRTWDRKYIELVVNLDSTWERLGIPIGNFGACGGDCQATVFKHDLDGKTGKEIILKLTRSWDDCRYLVFAHHTRRSGQWKVLGYIDHDFNRYQMARHRIVRAFGRNWLVIRGQEGSGSGYSLYGETWYSVSHRGVKPVLQYPVDGRTVPGAGLEWELRNRAVALTNGHNRRPILRLSFVVLYTATGFKDSEFTTRFVTKRHADYLWNRRSREFVFDGHRSTISEREMDVVANLATEPSIENQGVKIGESTFFSSLKGFVGSSFEMFLKLNVRRLTKIAQGADNRSKEWLGLFLEECDDIPEKLALEKALQERLPQSRKQR